MAWQLTARYPGYCKNCQTRWSAGDAIAWTPANPATRERAHGVHQHCPPKKPVASVAEGVAADFKLEALTGQPGFLARSLVRRLPGKGRTKAMGLLGPPLGVLAVVLVVKTFSGTRQYGPSRKALCLTADGKTVWTPAHNVASVTKTVDDPEVLDLWVAFKQHQQEQGYQ